MYQCSTQFHEAQVCNFHKILFTNRHTKLTGRREQTSPSNPSPIKIGPVFVSTTLLLQVSCRQKWMSPHSSLTISFNWDEISVFRNHPLGAKKKKDPSNSFWVWTKLVDQSALKTHCHQCQATKCPPPPCKHTAASWEYITVAVQFIYWELCNICWI